MKDPQYARYAGVGLQFSLTIALFAWLGYWADEKLGSRPWLLLLGVAIGFAASLYSLVLKFPSKPHS